MDFLIPRFTELTMDSSGDLRCLSWWVRARQEMESGDQDAAFIFYWIAFNAAYAEDRRSGLSNRPPSRAAVARSGYFDKIIDLDDRGRVYDMIQRNEHASQILRNYHNGLSRYDNRESWSRGDPGVHESPTDQTTRHILSRMCRLFDYLYVRRNQLIHGSATWNDPENRARVEADARVVASLVPLFIDLMLDNPKANWGDPPYPAA